MPVPKHERTTPNRNEVELAAGQKIVIGHGGDTNLGLPQFQNFETMSEISVGQGPNNVAGETQPARRLYVLYAIDQEQPPYKDYSDRAQSEGVPPSEYMLALGSPTAIGKVSSFDAIAFIHVPASVVGRGGDTRWFGYGRHQDNPKTWSPLAGEESIAEEQIKISVNRDRQQVVLNGLSVDSPTVVRAGNIVSPNPGETDHPVGESGSEQQVAARGLGARVKQALRKRK